MLIDNLIVSPDASTLPVASCAELDYGQEFDVVCTVHHIAVR